MGLLWYLGDIVQPSPKQRSESSPNRLFVYGVLILKGEQLTIEITLMIHSLFHRGHAEIFWSRTILGVTFSFFLGGF